MLKVGCAWYFDDFFPRSILKVTWKSKQSLKICYALKATVFSSKNAGKRSRVCGLNKNQTRIGMIVSWQYLLKFHNQNIQN